MRSLEKWRILMYSKKIPFQLLCNCILSPFPPSCRSHWFSSERWKKSIFVQNTTEIIAPRLLYIWKQIRYDDRIDTKFFPSRWLTLTNNEFISRFFFVLFERIHSWHSFLDDISKKLLSKSKYDLFNKVPSLRWFVTGKYEYERVKCDRGALLQIEKSYENKINVGFSPKHIRDLTFFFFRRNEDNTIIIVVFFFIFTNHSSCVRNTVHHTHTHKKLVH